MQYTPALSPFASPAENISAKRAFSGVAFVCLFFYFKKKKKKKVAKAFPRRRSALLSDFLHSRAVFPILRGKAGLSLRTADADALVPFLVSPSTGQAWTPVPTPNRNVNASHLKDGNEEGCSLLPNEPPC